MFSSSSCASMFSSSSCLLMSSSSSCPDISSSSFGYFISSTFSQLECSIPSHIQEPSSCCSHSACSIPSQDHAITATSSSLYGECSTILSLLIVSIATPPSIFLFRSNPEAVALPRVLFG